MFFGSSSKCFFFSPPGQIDSSGIRFYVTSQLRPFDAGVMELGLEYSNKMAIPPGQISFPLTGFCIQQCTDIVSYECFHFAKINITSDIYIDLAFSNEFCQTVTISQVHFTCISKSVVTKICF